MPGSSSLSLRSEEPERPAAAGRGGLAAVALVIAAATAGGLGWALFRARERAEALEQRVAAAERKAEQSLVVSRDAFQRAAVAEAAARAAAEGRQLAESEREAARQEAEAARQEATTAQEAAARAQAEAERIRKQAEAEVARLETALGQVAETRRTALGLVMNLGEDRLRFAFDKADLRPQDKELLSRIAGILMTSRDYTVSVNGHTDDVGSDEYNQKLSERRARAVRDYLVEAGLSPEILSVQGHGKKLPLVPGTSEAARAKNRRVELGIVNTRIRYGR